MSFETGTSPTTHRWALRYTSWKHCTNFYFGVMFKSVITFSGMSGISSNLLPFKASLRRRKKKKSGELISGENDGCSIAPTPFSQELYDDIGCAWASVDVDLIIHHSSRMSIHQAYSYSLESNSFWTGRDLTIFLTFNGTCFRTSSRREIPCNVSRICIAELSGA